MPDAPRDARVVPAGGALSGTTVLELGSRIGAGVCGSLLAQLGADVVLVEPNEPAGTRGKWRHRALFAAGKKSLRADPSRQEDRDLVRRLLARCNALIVSSDVDGDFAPSVPAGFEAEAVVCDVTAHGHSGPLAGRPDEEWQIQAMSGIIETTGMADGPPVPIPLPIVEFMTGVYAAAAVVAALREMRRSSAGQLIDMALYDCAFSAMATFLPRPLAGSREPVRRAGNRHAMIAPWNVYQARDGWLLVCVGSDAQWQRLCDIMGRPDLRAASEFARTPGRLARAGEIDALVQAWTGQHTLEACVHALNAAQIACGPIVCIDGHPREVNLDHRGMICRLRDPVSGRDVVLPGSPLRMSACSGRPPERIPAPDADRDVIGELASRRRRQEASPSAPSAGPRAPLAGIRIVEIGHYTTVPLCTRILASLGAEVIKVEPPEGEATRDWPPTQHGQGYFFTYTNSDKRSLVLDLRRDADAADLRQLVGRADVLIENLKPGALARRGFSPAEMTALNPALIYCSISGFGAESLYAGRPAYDSVVQAMSGLMDRVRSHGVPVKTGISSADLLGAEMGVLAVLAALAWRDRTGAGQYIDLSMQDIAAWATQTAWNAVHPADRPACALACRDGYVVALPETEHAAQELAKLTRPLERAEAVAELARLRVQVAPVLTVHEMLAQPHTAARGLWFPVSEDGETWPLLASPLRLTRPPPAVRKPMPALGRDSAEILASLRRGAASR